MRLASSALELYITMHRVVEHCDTKFPWADMHARLTSEPGDFAELTYLLPQGHPVGKTIGAQAWRVNAGTTSPAKHETTNFIFHVISGSGSTTVKHVEAGNEYSLSWKQGDTFCVPSWHRFEHTAEQREDVFLFCFNDRPMLDALGWWRTPNDI